MIEIKALISHPMETGFRPGPTASWYRATSSAASSAPITARRSSRADLHPAIAANPFLAFTTVAKESGVLEFHWTGDNGQEQIETAKITVA